MLACPGTALDKLRVHAVRQDYIDDLNIGVVSELIEAFVVVQAALRDAVLGGDFAGLLPIATDERGDTAILAFAEGGKDLVEGKRAKADDGVAGALGWRFEGTRVFSEASDGACSCGSVTALLAFGFAALWATAGAAPRGARPAAASAEVAARRKDRRDVSESAAIAEVSRREWVDIPVRCVAGKA